MMNGEKVMVWKETFSVLQGTVSVVGWDSQKTIVDHKKRHRKTSVAIHELVENGVRRVN
jgi:hypothetical protein